MKKIAIVIMVAGLSLAVLGKAAGRQTSNWQRTTRARFVAQHIMNDLNLTDGQKASIKAILEKEKPTIQLLAAQMLQANEQLRSKTTFDEAFVRSVAQQRNATLTEALVEKEKVRAQIFAVLTPAQQQKANQIADEVRAMIQDRIVTLGDQL